jgi:ceramide glucosyltransferase
MALHQTIAQATAWLSLFCIIASVFGCVYALGAAWAVHWFVRRPDPAVPAVQPDVSILKPLCGKEPQLFENIQSFLIQNYAGNTQVIFGVQDPADEAILVVKSLMQHHPGLDLHLVVDDAMHGANRKISNLINMASLIRNPVVILADSDVAVGPDYLGVLAAELAEPGVGAVSCLYRGLQVGGFWSRFAAMSVHDHFLPGAAVGMALGIAKPCVGQTIAMSRETLARIGGFEIVADELADDYVIGEAVRRAGLRVVVPRMLVATMFPETSISETAAHELRWARTIFAIDPIGYIGSGITYALPWSLIGAVLRGFDGLGLAAVLSALACRLFLKYRLTRELGLPNPEYALTLFRDFFSFAVYFGSFWSKRVSWRGREFVVRRDGTMAASVHAEAVSAKFGKAMK